MVQLFVHRGEILVVLEDRVGRRTRERWPLSEPDPSAALRRVARHLARQAEVEGVVRLRLRRERGGTLHDDPELARLFRKAFEAERRRP